MTARVTLEVVRGLIKGKKFVFEDRATCIMGRAKDCDPQIPSPKGKATVSRHHCLLDINPPAIRVRDFGSLNGTFVNGEKIGQRKRGQQAGSNEWVKFREVDLKHGDKIRIGRTVLRVSVFLPTIRAARVEPPVPPPQAQVECAGVSPRQTGPEPPAAAVSSTASTVPAARMCAKCGRDVASEITDHRQGEYVCAACRSDPFELMKVLLQHASTGDAELVAIRGYEIVRELGRGGMGAVYLAQHQESGRSVALKVMLPKVAADRRATDSFLRETFNTKALEHPNVVRLFESGCSRGTFFFTLEFCDLGSVDRLIKRRGGKLSVDEAGPIILQALDGLAYAHSAEVPYVKLQDGQVVKGRGLVHRDLKPHNVFLCGPRSSRVAKLGDYGLSKAFDLAGLSGHTYTGDVAGTPHFMPRQQVLNFRDAGPEVDVWALAATLYCMLTGHVPRNFSKDKDPWQVVLQSDPIPIRQREPSIPDRLAGVIDHALRDRPEIGFQIAPDLKQALEWVL